MVRIHILRSGTSYHLRPTLEGIPSNPAFPAGDMHRPLFLFVGEFAYGSNALGYDFDAFDGRSCDGVDKVDMRILIIVYLKKWRSDSC
jgi:hypothetical protein